MKDRILLTLHEAAQAHDVHFLYACESGSRAWDFASQNSDYDVRFLYVRPQSAYLQLDAPRDVIELPIVKDLDINGWDIFKALHLLRKSNPPLLEWLFSPIVYLEASPTIARLRTIVQNSYRSPSVFYHYRQMAYGNYHQYIEGKQPVPLKKYLYVIRPIVALLFIEQQGSFPPTSFIQTLACVQIEPDVREHIHVLVARKQSGDELALGDADYVLNAFIEGHLARWDGPAFTHHDSSELTQQLNEVLHDALSEYEKGRSL